MEHEKLRKECASVGCQIGLISEPNIEIVSGDNKLADLVIAAHSKIADDPGVISLRDYLQADSRWDAYVACRKAVTQQARQARYREETDSLRLKADEDFVIGSEDWLAAIEVWKAAKNTIRAELPYEVE